MRNKDGSNYQPYLIIFLAAILLFYGLQSVSFTQYIEFYYLESAREMIELRQWLVPSFNYSYRFDKPILFYWLVVLFFKGLGVNLASARLISAIFGAGTLYLTYRIARERSGKLGGWLAAAILLSTPHFILISRSATTDMMLTFFITFSLFAYFSFLEGAKRGWFFPLYASLALATLTKGPIGFVIPVLVIFSHLAVGWDKEKLFNLKPVKGALLYLAIILPWTLAIIKEYGLKAMLSIVHAADAAGKDPIKEPLYYYFQHIFGEFFPWGPLLIILFVVVLLNRELFKERFKRDLLPFLWFLVPLLFLSIFDKKIARYMLPVAPPMAILLADILIDSLEKGRRGVVGIYKIYSYLLAILLLALSIGTMFMAFMVSKSSFNFSLGLPALPLLFLFGSVGIITLVVRGREVDIPLAFAATVIPVFIIVGVHLIPKMDSRPLMEFGHIINKELSQEAVVSIYREQPNDLIFFAARKIVVIGSPDELKNFAAEEGERFCVIYEKDFNSLPNQVRADLNIVYWRHRWRDIDTLSKFERFLGNPEEFKSWVYLVKIGGGAGN
ncbi:MAG: glycosyltransferase family 39 protein [Nitrospinota bacterium]|nr:glycosyltransferase family 39 protein [Nitrospinota bacterium]